MVEYVDAGPRAEMMGAWARTREFGHEHWASEYSLTCLKIVLGRFQGFQPSQKPAKRESFSLVSRRLWEPLWEATGASQMPRSLKLLRYRVHFYRVAPLVPMGTLSHKAIVVP